MRHLLLSISLLTIFSAFSILTGLDDIIEGVKKGDAVSMARYFDNTVDLTLPNKTNSYSKSQAQMVLRDFFMANPVLGFDILQKVQSNNSQYCIGNLRTSKATFLMTILLKSKNGKLILQELRIEKK